jgi:SAM-dependent methyltransferase
VHQWIDIKDGKVFRAPEAAMILHNKTSARQRRSNARVAAYEERFRGGQNGKPFKVNLGSGNRRIGDDWYNLDVQDLPNVDIVWDMTPQMAWNEHPYPYPGHLPFRDDSVDEVRAHHVLEHFSYHHVTDVLRDWVRVLKPGGRIELAFPDMEGLIGAYSKSNRNYLSAVQLLYGGQTNEWDRHYTAMDWQWIRGQLIHKGCDPDSIHRMPSEPERARPHEQELRVEARKKR